MSLDFIPTKDRLLYLVEQHDDNVDDSIIDTICKSIIEINNEDEYLFKLGVIHNYVYTPSPIKLYINTYGGDVYAFFGLIDTIITSKTPIHTIVLGAAMSCGLLVALAGHKRFANKNSTFMYHQISSGEWGTTKNQEENLIETKRLQKLVEDYILSKSKITKKQLLDNYKSKKDWYITSEEAIKYSIIDEII